MSIFETPLPIGPRGLFMPSDEMHEQLYANWVFKAFEHDIVLDFHLPSCTRDISDLKNALKALILLDTADMDTTGYSHPELGGEAGKWKAMSSMQKGIRRADFDAAWRPCVALLNGNNTAAQMWRRLAIIAFEDIGLADPYTAAVVCLLAGTKPLRTQLGEEVALAYALKWMCTAPKSRDLCDAVVFAMLPQNFEDLVGEINALPYADMVGQAADLDKSFAWRFMCHGRMYGPKFKTTSHENPPGTPMDTFKMCEALGVPPLFSHITFECYRRSGEVLGIPIPFILQWMCASEEAFLAKDPFEIGEDVMMHGVHAATFDKHTWKGKAALRNFIKQCQPVKQWLNKNCTGDHFGALERAVFYTEGAILRPRLYFNGASQFFDDVLDAKLVSNGMPDPKLGREFYRLVQENLPQLNELRA